MAVRNSSYRSRELSEIGPRTVTHIISNVSFGAGGDKTFGIKAPNGYSTGLIIDVGVNVSETFNAVTTPAYVRLGTASDTDAYAQLQMDTATATDTWNTQDDTDAIINEQVSSSQIEVSCIAPTGGVPSGIGDVYVVIDWYI